jgi:hypothetical protein
LRPAAGKFQGVGPFRPLDETSRRRPAPSSQGVAGARAQARDTIASLRKLASERYTSAFASGIAYAGIGDRDRAIAQLEQAFAERSDSMVIVRVYPLLDTLHSDPRFQNLVRRIGFSTPEISDRNSR